MRHGVDVRAHKADGIQDIENGIQCYTTIWDCFTKSSDGENVVCTVCDETIQNQSEENLFDHLKKKHNEIQMIETRSDAESSDTEMGHKSNELHGNPKKKNLNVWRLFTKISNEDKMVECKLCKMSISYADENNIAEHVNDKHMHVLSDDKYVTFANEYKEPQCYSTEFKKARKRKHSRRHRDSDTSEDGNLEIYDNIEAASTRDDSLEHFGKYIVSLLKQLPLDLSRKLQLDFITQIYEARTKIVASDRESE